MQEADRVVCIKTKLFDCNYLNPAFNHFYVIDGAICFIILNEVRVVRGFGINRQEALFDALDKL
jgi:hypothetical protein